MDRETAERLTKLESWKDDLQEERKEWHSLIRNTILKTVSSLIMVGTAGVLYGWHLPENVRKSIADWMSK